MTAARKNAARKRKNPKVIPANEVEGPPNQKYPAVTELAMLAVQLLGKPEPDENGEESHSEEDYTTAVYKALKLWRYAEREINGAKKLDEYGWESNADYRAKQKEYEVLYPRMRKRLDESPKEGETWPFGKVASKLIPPGRQDAPGYLEELLKRLGWPKRDPVDQRTFVMLAIEIEKELLDNEKALKSKKMKELRAIGVEKQKAQPKKKV
jgi:hypothetical protein